MKLMIKVLMLIGLTGSIVSCKLYDEILDKVEDSLKRKDHPSESNAVSAKSSDGKKADIKTGVQDSGRNGHGARSLNDAGEGVQREGAVNRNIGVNVEIKPDIDGPKDEVVVKNLDDDRLNKEQGDLAFNHFANEVNESENIKKQAENQLEEVNKISEELNKKKARLDEMKVKIDSAESGFQKARTSGNVSDKELLPNLDKAIKKVKTSKKTAENSEYNTASLALTHARNDFELAVLEADNVSREITRGSNAYIWHYYSNAKKSINKAEDMLKEAKEQQDKLNSKMKQVEKDFTELEQIYKEFKNQNPIIKR
ncbi:coiled-coil domain-containing protein [Borrelia sp. RT1S]|uniref:coiled-coil domain-containing protein n=1 Tax=Borrelia sp. RT1S TaxID=2898580 RepID=UPI001E4F8F9A|nr:hypothetical protein [Borrelia sp. RT1S]UGQ17806.1 hypothetical protein LSO05_05090 [Borrelia sp. RT1S]